MRVDIRVPIGGMFTVIGLMLLVFGLATAGNTQMYARSLAININFWWGLVMLVFGLTMFYFGRRARPGN